MTLIDLILSLHKYFIFLFYYLLLGTAAIAVLWQKILIGFAWTPSAPCVKFISNGVWGELFD